MHQFSYTTDRYSEFISNPSPLLKNRQNLIALLRLLGRQLRALLLSALDHNHTQETTNNGDTGKNQNNRNADSPYAGREEAVKGVFFFDKGLLKCG